MAWYFKLIAPDLTDKVWSVIDGANVEEIQKQLESAGPGECVRIPTRLQDQIRETPLFVRPEKWGAWQFFHHDPDVVE